MSPEAPSLAPGLDNPLEHSNSLPPPPGCSSW